MTQIRPATKQDIPKIIEYQVNLAKETEDLDLDTAKLTAGVSAVFADPNKGCYYVAEVEGKVVGCLITMYEWSDWGNAQVMWIASLYVEKEYRGKGVFRKFYEYIQNLVINSEEFRGIRLYVNKTNTNADNVYKKLGMDGTHYNLYEWMYR